MLGSQIEVNFRFVILVANLAIIPTFVAVALFLYGPARASCGRFANPTKNSATATKSFPSVEARP